MTDRTWKIRSQMPDGSWGPYRTVTLEQYLAEIAAASAEARAIHTANVAQIAAQR
jgi:hypothetical protein